MTAVPPPTDLPVLLDQLDEARAIVDPGTCVSLALPDGRPTVRDGALMVIALCRTEADAALIAAAVNALPQLTAAVRGVLALADELDQELADRGVLLDRVVRPGDRLRSAILAALTPGADTAGATT